MLLKTIYRILHKDSYKETATLNQVFLFNQIMFICYKTTAILYQLIFSVTKKTLLRFQIAFKISTFELNV